MRPFLHQGDSAMRHRASTRVRVSPRCAGESAGETGRSSVRSHRKTSFSTSDGTESANLAVKVCVAYGISGGVNHIVVSAIEHPSVLASVEFLEKQGGSPPRRSRWTQRVRES